MIDIQPSRRTTRFAAAASALAAVTLLAGCGEIVERGTEAAIEQGSGGDVDIDLDDDGGSFSIQSEDGELSMDVDGEGTASLSIETDDGSFSSQSGTDMPDGFPSFVFVPRGIQVISAFEQNLDGETGYIVNGRVDGDGDDLYDAIVGTYDEDPSTVYEGNGLRNFEYENIDGYRVGYTISADGDGNTVLTVNAHPAER